MKTGLVFWCELMKRVLMVFDPGFTGLDFDTSIHNPGRTSISFLVRDLEHTISTLRAKGVAPAEPFDSHLGMRGIRIEDPDGNLVVIHAPTERSPEWRWKQATGANPHFVRLETAYRSSVATGGPPASR